MIIHGSCKKRRSLYLQLSKRINHAYITETSFLRSYTLISILFNYLLCYATLIASLWRMEWKSVLHLWTGACFVFSSRSHLHPRLVPGLQSEFCEMQ